MAVIRELGKGNQNVEIMDGVTKTVRTNGILRLIPKVIERTIQPKLELWKLDISLVEMILDALRRPGSGAYKRGPG